MRTQSEESAAPEPVSATPRLAMAVTERIRPHQETTAGLAAIRREQMEGHLAILKTALVGSGITGLVVVAAQRPHVPDPMLVLWAIALAFTLGLRGLAALGYGLAEDHGREASDSRWLTRFRALYLVHGIVWGSAAWLLFPVGEISSQIVPVFAIVLVGVGALGVGAFDPKAAVLFTLLAFVPLAFRLLLEGGDAYIYMSVLLLILLVYVRQIARRAHGHVREAVALRVAEEARIETLLGSEQRLEAEIDARRASEEQTRLALRAAEAANHAKNDFLARMSHEFRTPLNGVLGAVQLMERTAHDPAAITQIGLVKASGEHLLNIVNDVLDFSKIAEGGMVLRPEPFSLHETLCEVGAAFREAAERRGLRFAIDVSHDVPSALRGDEFRLRQVLTNLLDNAVKFTAAGEVRLSVSAPEVDRARALVRFEVTDTGVGIPPSQRARIFESFSQVEEATVRRFGGTGLGLAICKGLVAAMGGEIGVREDSLPGSAFWFEVRLAHAARAQEATLRLCPSPLIDTPSPPLSADRPAPTAASPRAAPGSLFDADVLLVEDNAVNSLIARELLSILGCKVQTAVDGSAAVDAIRQRHYDLVLMDLHMPVMDGFSATRLVREREQTDERPRTPIVALTADAFGVGRERCLAAGMDDYAVKPFGLDTLERLLRRFCSGRLR